MTPTPPSDEDIVAAIRQEIASPTLDAAEPARDWPEQVRELQRRFRAEPVGGRLLPLKKLAYWLTASAFDRQGKVIEALLDGVEKEMARRSQDRPASRAPTVSPGSSTPVELRGEQPSPSGLERVLQADAEMLVPERLLLYGLVFGRRPRRMLEIGTFRGGSSDIICAALDDLGEGRLICVDPEPRVSPEVLARIEDRAEIVVGPSPDVLSEARRRAGGPFDLALIDGDHSHQGVLRDITGTLPHLAPGAHLLFHDSHYFEVADALGEALARHRDVLVDAGELSLLAQQEKGPVQQVDGRKVLWGGLRLLRYLG